MDDLQKLFNLQRAMEAEKQFDAYKANWPKRIAPSTCTRVGEMVGRNGAKFEVDLSGDPLVDMLRCDVLLLFEASVGRWFPLRGWPEHLPMKAKQRLLFYARQLRWGFNEALPFVIIFTGVDGGREVVRVDQEDLYSPLLDLW